MDAAGPAGPGLRRVAGTAQVWGADLGARPLGASLRLFLHVLCLLPCPLHFCAAAFQRPGSYGLALPQRQPLPGAALELGLLQFQVRASSSCPPPSRVHSFPMFSKESHRLDTADHSGPP